MENPSKLLIYKRGRQMNNQSKLLYPVFTTFTLSRNSHRYANEKSLTKKIKKGRTL